MFLLFPAVAVLAFCLNLSSAQTLISPTLPACAQQCAILLQAQQGCVPPTAPVTDQATYISCFCQSGFLAPLVSGGVPAASSICPQCPQADSQTFFNWFQGLCPAPGSNKPPVTVLITSSATSRSLVAPTTTANANTKGGSTISNTPPPDNRSW